MKVSFVNEKLTILYGSQTGNAQDVAESIWRESKRFHYTGLVKAMDDYNVLELINEQCVLFVCATTGQGEEPDNMKSFWKFLLRKSLPHDSLKHLRFAVLGLGDSSYAKFNFAAKRLNKRLQQLGGQMLVPLGLGDDQHDLGYDAVADSWTADLWLKLNLLYPLPEGVAPLDKHSKILPRWQVAALSTNVASIRSRPLYDSSKPSQSFEAIIIENLRTTIDSHFQDVRLIKLSTNGSHYSPGDVVVLRPKNLPSQVEFFQNVLHANGVEITAESVFKLSENTPEFPVPAPLQFTVTFKQLCEEYFDLTAIPRRRTFEVLAQLTDSELEKEKCLEFTTAEGQEELYSYCNRPKRNIVEVLQDFPHATKNITKDILFELLNPIKPREFSIASSFTHTPNEIHILVAVVKYKTKLKKERLGLCSNYLADLKQGDSLAAWTKPGSFKFPKNSDSIVIMVGPGTGLAPFRNYILERVAESTGNANNLILFFGCRGQNVDFHAKDELQQLERDKKLCLICAFSRDQEQKIYVQHKILESAALIWNALRTKKAFIYVAGNAKNMPTAVRESFETICINNGGMSEEDAAKFMSEMDRTNRYQTETWS